MTFGLEGIIIFLLVILPGFIAHNASRLYVPRPKPPTALEEVAAAVQNTLLIHIVGVIIGVFGAKLFLLLDWGSPDLNLLLAKGIPDYFKVHPLRTTAAGALYAVYLLLAGYTVGVLNVTHRLGLAYHWLLRVTPVLR